MKKLFIICVLTIVSVAAGAQQNYPSQLTVAQDGSGHYKSIQEAINAVRAYSPVHITITIKNGVYREKIIVPAWVTNISFIGESAEQTIITHDDYSGKYMATGNDTLADKRKFSTFNSYTVWVQGNDVTMQNLTIRNTAGSVGQAVALHVDGDRFVIRNCRLLGNQDTLLTANDSSRQYYYDCLIEGTTDFIFGPATAVFQDCTIRSLRNSYITAASTPSWKKFGYVFINCKLVANDEAQKVYLGRPWRSYARTVFINCEMGKHIRPEGWHNWDKPGNEQTVYYAEYKSQGEGASPDTRVKWAKQLTKKQAKSYTLRKILAGDDNWQPQNGWGPK